MRRMILPAAVVAVFLFFDISIAGRAPRGVGGFELGRDINDYAHLVKMDSCLMIRDMEYLQEARINYIKGFKSGMIAFGDCEKTGKILRIKLKYANTTKKFFNTLLAKFKQRFGEPSEWRGDPFHIVIAWKWSFVNQDNDRISLIIQHNTENPEEKRGNAVKLTNTSQIEREARCYMKKQGGDAGRRRSPEQKDDAPPDWDAFIPR